MDDEEGLDFHVSLLTDGEEGVVVVEEDSGLDGGMVSSAEVSVVKDDSSLDGGSVSSAAVLSEDGSDLDMDGGSDSSPQDCSDLDLAAASVEVPVLRRSPRIAVKRVAAETLETTTATALVQRPSRISEKKQWKKAVVKTVRRSARLAGSKSVNYRL